MKFNIVITVHIPFSEITMRFICFKLFSLNFVHSVYRQIDKTHAHMAIEHAHITIELITLRYVQIL